MNTFEFELLCVGRSLMDLYANEIGLPLPQVRTLSAYLGGSPTNIAVGARRLGIKTAMLTAVAPDPIGDFVIEAFRREDVDVNFSPRKAGRRTSAAVVAIEPPDRFPLVYFRENCADTELGVDDVLEAPVRRSRIVLIAGTNLCREPCRSATLIAAELARAAGAKVFLVLDLRADQWHDTRAYGVNMRAAMRLADVVVGTADEVKATSLLGSAGVRVEAGQVSEARAGGDLEESIQGVLSSGVEALVMTRGAKGAAIYRPGGEKIEAPGFPVEILNTMGAGDAFTAGFLHGYLRGWEWQKSARLGNACGALVVQRHGCSQFMPRIEEAMEFAGLHGGL